MAYNAYTRGGEHGEAEAGWDDWASGTRGLCAVPCSPVRRMSTTAYYRSQMGGTIVVQLFGSNLKIGAPKVD